VLPIPPLNMHLKPGQRDGAWKKLTTFERDLHGLKGRRCSWTWTW
jgi:hypothetical protein